jgi:hypothetical protein
MRAPECPLGEVKPLQKYTPPLPEIFPEHWPYIAVLKSQEATYFGRAGAAVLTFFYTN